MPGRRLVCAGGAVLDLKLHLYAPSVPGTSNPAIATTSFGGVARNVAEGLAGLLAGTDVAVELVSAIGDDAAGTALVAHLAARGVGTGAVRVFPGQVSAQYVAVLEPDGNLTIGTAAMGVLDLIDATALDAAWPRDGWLFCDGNLSGEVLAFVLDRARQSGTMVVFDGVSTAKVARLPADLHGLGLLSCNRDEARAWLRHHRIPIGDDEDDVTLGRRLHAAGAEAVLLTRGAAGLVVIDAGQAHEVAAVPADPVDVTGAGDALIAGTLAALVLGLDLAEAAGFGAERAARTVESEHSVLPA